MKNVIPILIFIIVISACQKQPAATFTTDKTEYYAGDTIHLTNTSENGHSYIWTMPNGSTQTTENAFYVVDTSVLYEKLTFQLEAISKHQRKKTIVTKQVLAVIKPKLDNNTFSYGNKILKCDHTILNRINNPYLIRASIDGYEHGELSFRINTDTNFVNLYGVYTLQQNKLNVRDKTAFAQLSYFCYDCFPAVTGVTDWTYTTVSGTMIIGNLNGKPHVIINDAKAVNSNSGQIIKISANMIIKQTIR
jgi:hypothetical protein